MSLLHPGAKANSRSPHGIFIDDEDHVWTTDRNDHTVVKYTRYGENLLELGTRGWGKYDGNAAGARRSIRRSTCRRA